MYPSLGPIGEIDRHAILAYAEVLDDGVEEELDEDDMLALETVSTSSLVGTCWFKCEDEDDDPKIQPCCVAQLRQGSPCANPPSESLTKSALPTGSSGSPHRHWRHIEYCPSR